MKLGFVSAILPELTLEEVFKIASEVGYDCVEIMCWPPEKAARRYAGVTHIEVDQLSEAAVAEIQALIEKYGVTISGLGYYGNPLTADRVEAARQINHISKLIDAAVVLGVDTVNTFIGRDHTLSVEDNWDRYIEVWRPIIEKAEKHKIYIGIENCPMSFTEDEWPGGKNLATTPDIWDRMYADIPSPYFGLNYDPSHMIIQHMDEIKPIVGYADRLHHVHAKDCHIDRDALDRVGVLSYPNLWHTPKLPGRGDVNWDKFFEALVAVGYKGAVCVEVEDREYEDGIENIIRALRKSHDFLRPFFG